ncbi:MAG: hypothetical protein QW780_01270 [Sulfolobales archaeon]
MALPLAYLPVAKISNPIVIARVDGISLDLRVEIIPSKGVDRVEIQEPVAKYVIEFKKELEKTINLGFKLVCEGRTDYDALAYVIITNQILRELLSRLKEEEYAVAYSIDYRLGLPDHISALRLIDLVSSHYAWRRGEPLVELGDRISFKVRAIRKAGKLGEPFLEVDREALVHVIGKSAIALAKAIIEGDIRRVKRIIEFANGLWYSIYGLRAPCGETHSTYVPGLEEVYCVELDFNPRTS